jgi:hypothetical protein
MLLDIFRTIEFSPLLVLPKAPASPRRGFLFEDVVLFAASVYLLKQDVTRVSSPAKQKRESGAVALSY